MKTIFLGLSIFLDLIELSDVITYAAAVIGSLSLCGVDPCPPYPIILIFTEVY